mgnify:CR=1 FL=1
MKKILNVLKVLTFVFFISAISFAEEYSEINKNTELSFYTGMFDYSDRGKKSTLFGIEHQNDELTRKSFLGILSPVTGGLITSDNAIYLYTGIQAQYNMGKLKITPSFTPGVYEQGDGKDLGHPLEFKSEVQLSFDLSKSSMFGMSYNHISNASKPKNLLIYLTSGSSFSLSR